MVTLMATVRLATEADIPRILELYRELVITTSHAEQVRIPSPDDFHRVFAEISASPGHELVVAQHGDDVIGTLVLVIVPNLSHGALPWALVENMVVDRRHQRGGVGRLLMDYALARARDAECYKIVLNSNKKRRDAHRFYLAVGFKPTAHGFRRYL